MSFEQEVVITGTGVVSPIGIGNDEFWQSLVDGKSGFVLREEMADTDFPIRIAAPVTGFNPKQYVKPRKAIKIMCRPIQFACTAAAMAVEEANLEGTTDPERIGVVFGTETFYSDPTEVKAAFNHCVVDSKFHYDRWDVESIRKIQPLWMLKYLPNMAASHVSIALDARGPSNSICQGEASGLLALIEAVTTIQRGAADVVVTGGTGSLMELTSVLYRCRDKMSQRIHSPETACRPFDIDRDGMVVGEGSGALVLESAAHAAKRGAKPLAKIAGWSRSFQDPTGPNFHEGLEYSFARALESAKLELSDIGVINASAGGDPITDLWEAQAIHNFFGDVPVVAHKGSFGNLGPAASAVELIGGLLSFRAGLIPQTINCEKPDPAFPIRLTQKTIDFPDEKSLLKTSVSATGQVASLILSNA